MAIDINANFNSALNMDKESISLTMATLIKDHTLTVSHKGMASTYGTMEVHIKETSKMDSEMDKVFLKPARIITTLIKDLLLMKKRTDMGFSIGLMAANIWEAIRMIFDKVMERCIGLMEIYRKANGKVVSRFDKVTL